MNPYKWIITRDFLAEQQGREDEYVIPSCVNVQGPEGCDTRTPDELPDTFRLYDGDDELCYEGKTDCLSNPSSPSGGFEPLDEFGGPDAGCTRIDYLIDGEWRML